MSFTCIHDGKRDSFDYAVGDVSKEVYSDVKKKVKDVEAYVFPLNPSEKN